MKDFDKPEQESVLERVRSYYRKRESRWGYKLLLGGVRHYGYYPLDQPGISMREAQIQMEDHLGKTLDLEPGARVLDAGCGEGSVALHLAQHFDLHVDGIDILEESILEARESAKRLGLAEQVSFKTSDFSDLRAPDSSYDGLYTMEALVHAPDHQVALREFFRVLKPGGRLILTEYSMPDLATVEPEVRDAFLSVCHKSAMHSYPEFVHGRFPSILAAVGFTDVEVQDLTARVEPMLRRLHHIAVVPYTILKWLNKADRLVNAEAAVQGYRLLEYFRYNMVVARRPID